jgi:NAD(P)-dependent dehydrogenase (short-subunit alcohol dehydrogenase family)
MIEQFNLHDKVAIVTGGYGHLGTSMVRALIKCNAIVIVAGRSLSKFQEKFSKEEQTRCVFRTIDISQRESIEKFFENILKEFGRVDILINNAHTISGNSQAKMSDEDWAFTFDGVVGSVYKTMSAVIPIMKKQNSGKIINISSMYGIVSPDFKTLYSGDECEKYTNPPHYGSAKAAMIQLTRYFAVLLGPNNIQVNAISPGPFPKTQIQESNPAFIERLKMKNPLNKIGKPEDLDGTIVLLSSAASDFITGQTIQIDGGWTIW